MVHYRYPSGRRAPRKIRRSHFLTAAFVAISMSPVAFYANLQELGTLSFAEVFGGSAHQAPAHHATEIATATHGDWNPVDPRPTLNAEAHAFAQNAPLATTFKPFKAQQVARAEPPAPPVKQESAQQLTTSPEMKMAQAAQPVPLPMPRPAEFKIQKQPEPVKVASAPVATPSAPVNDPPLIEKLFGIKPATPPESALGYAAIDSNIAPSARINPAPSAGAGTAVYDISAQMVIMPNGERLEAHSGLGDKLDDPRYVHVRMQGPTPPGTYVLTEREALFHGVRALRMTPVGGSGAIYGRDGILAHTYMLGPNGDSNGCVSFRDYNRFLQAYLRGEVKRLVVVAGRKQDLLPRTVNRNQRLTVPERDS